MKIKYPLETAKVIAEKIEASIAPFCSKILVVGSIRRCKSMVGDIEVLVIPKYQELQLVDDMFPQIVNVTFVQIQKLVGQNILHFRKKIDGTIANGAQVKLLRHTESNIPVDMFFCTKETWYSALVCRTGGKENNEEIAKRAKRQGYHWKMNGPGFESMLDGTVIPVTSEAEIYKFVGMPFVLPHQRL